MPLLALSHDLLRIRALTTRAPTQTKTNQVGETPVLAICELILIRGNIRRVIDELHELIKESEILITNRLCHASSPTVTVSIGKQRPLTFIRDRGLDRKSTRLNSSH